MERPLGGLGLRSADVLDFDLGRISFVEDVPLLVAGHVPLAYGDRDQLDALERDVEGGLCCPTMRRESIGTATLAPGSSRKRCFRSTLRRRTVRPTINDGCAACQIAFGIAAR